MIDDEFFLRNIETFKLDYLGCKICNGVIHHTDAKCRWCGSKKIRGARTINYYRLGAIFSVLVFFFILGLLHVSVIFVVLPGLAISYFLCKKYQDRWLTKRWY